MDVQLNHRLSVLLLGGPLAAGAAAALSVYFTVLAAVRGKGRGRPPPSKLGGGV